VNTGFNRRRIEARRVGLGEIGLERHAIRDFSGTCGEQRASRRIRRRRQRVLRTQGCFRRRRQPCRSHLPVYERFECVPQLYPQGEIGCYRLCFQNGLQWLVCAGRRDCARRNVDKCGRATVDRQEFAELKLPCQRPRGIAQFGSQARVERSARTDVDHAVAVAGGTATSTACGASARGLG
jgi:hypothetical protein